MSKKWISILVVAVVVALAPASAFANCAAAVVGFVAYGGAYTPPPAVPAFPQDPVPATAVQGGSQIFYTQAGTPLNVANEGRTERVADVLVWEDGAAGYQCFKTNNNIRITYNAAITSAPSVTAPNVTYFDVYDTAQPNGLAITASTTQAQVPGGGTQTVVIVTVQQAGTYNSGVSSNVTTPGGVLGGLAAGAGSAFRIKNIRVDATSLNPAGAPPLNQVLVNVTNSAGAMTAGATLLPTLNIVGTAFTSFKSASISAVGAGLQNSGTGLTAKGSFTFTENQAGAMRIAKGSCVSQTLASDTCASQVANDIATGDTSFIFDAGTSLPSGVSVSWPTTISNSATPAIVGPPAGTTGYVLTLRNTPTCSGPGSQCFAIYDTTKTDAGGLAPVVVDTTTGATAANGAPTTNVNPTVGVAIASTSGAGAVTLHGFFGPGESSGVGCANDDVQASAVPRYISTCGAGTAAPTRNLFSGTWFNINTNQTALLIPYATNLFGYQTGIVVSNTSAFGAAFTAAASQKGGLKFYFFPTNGTAFTLNTDVTTGGVGNVAGTRGLDANGQLAGGGIFAGSMNALLTAAGQPAGSSFDGYIIIVAGFQLAHGQVAVISPNGTAAYSNLLVIPNSGGVRGVPETLTE